MPSSEMPTNTPPSDPLTIVRDAFWSVIEANSFFADYVRNGNKIRFDDEIGLKPNVGHGDMPEIVIVPEDCSQDGMGSSSTAYLSIGYRVYVSTGSKNNKMISLCQWEVYRAIQTFCLICGRFQYNGQRFIQRAKMTSGTQSLSDAERNRGIDGWCSAWGVQVDMVFRRSDVEYNVPAENNNNEDS